MVIQVTLDEWLAQCQNSEGFWYVKRLSGNDTQATGGHQAGPYIARAEAFQLFPELNTPSRRNPRVDFTAYAESHGYAASPNIIWYNNRLFGGTRNETRITRLGGQESPLLDEDNTGAIVLFFFTGGVGSRHCSYWICRDEAEEDRVESFAGPVEPGEQLFWNTDVEGTTSAEFVRSGGNCWLDRQDMPSQWLKEFPTPQEVFDTALARQPYSNLSLDARVMRRRDCEYAVFRSVELAFEFSTIRKGFSSIDSFIARAQTILQRRKARSGRSLELHMNRILTEEQIPYVFQPVTEAGKRPDFVFPSQQAYNSPEFPASHLRMLAAKTTVRERWRQVITEADRIQIKHLFTLQEGVSVNQFAQMRDSDVRLVVPKSLHSKYPVGVRPHLMTLKDFVEELREL